eukprot:scaffold4737_cov371-Prasinococcus_capsulatus_cf.AAC.6
MSWAAGRATAAPDGSSRGLRLRFSGNTTLVNQPGSACAAAPARDASSGALPCSRARSGWRSPAYMHPIVVSLRSDNASSDRDERTVVGCDNSDSGLSQTERTPPLPFWLGRRLWRRVCGPRTTMSAAKDTMRMRTEIARSRRRLRAARACSSGGEGGSSSTIAAEDGASLGASHCSSCILAGGGGGAAAAGASPSDSSAAVASKRKRNSTACLRMVAACPGGRSAVRDRRPIPSRRCRKRSRRRRLPLPLRCLHRRRRVAPPCYGARTGLLLRPSVHRGSLCPGYASGASVLEAAVRRGRVSCARAVKRPGAAGSAAAQGRPRRERGA